MPRAVRLVWCGTLLAAASYLSVHSNAAQPEDPASAPVLAQSAASASPRLVFDKYCVTCHNEKLKTAGLMLDRIDVDHVGDRAETWEKVVRKLRTQEMPPPGRARPDQATYGQV